MTAIRGGALGAFGARQFALARPIALLVAIVCGTATMLPLLVLTVTASPASAATAPTGAAAGLPHCPPDCGAVAAGDPLLVGFMTANPGVGWQAFPAAESQAYVNTLRRNLSRSAGPATTNVAAARWKSVTGGYGLLITLVSSTSLAKVRLQSPVGDAADLCSSAGGAPTGSPIHIPGIPGSVAGTCVLRPSSQIKGAAVAAFIRGNVAVLVEISSQSKEDVDPR